MLRLRKENAIKALKSALDGTLSASESLAPRLRMIMVAEATEGYAFSLLNFDQNCNITWLTIGYLTSISEFYFSTGFYSGGDFHP